MTDQDEKTRRRIRFESGERTGGKGLGSIFWSGDLDYESGVKTHLLREQNNLLKEAREEAKKAQAKAEWDQFLEESHRESQNGIQWLLGYAQHEKKWKSLTKVANVAKLSDEKLLDHYHALSKEVDSLKRAKYDAGSGNYPDDIGKTAKSAYDNVSAEQYRRDNESRKRYVDSLGERDTQLLKGIEGLSRALAEYMSAYRDKADGANQLKRVSEAADKATTQIDRLQTALIPPIYSLLEETMGTPLKTIKAEILKGPKLARTYFDAKKKASDSTIAVWGFAVFVIIGTPFMHISLPWQAYPILLVAPYLLQRFVFSKSAPSHIELWTKHVSRVVQYGEQTQSAFRGVWRYPYSPDWALMPFCTPKSVTGS